MPASDDESRGWAESLRSLALFALLSIGMTWPLASAPARISVPNDDTYGNAWAIHWVVHQASRDPLRLFDSNMFHPWTRSLAYAESLIPQALLAWPVLAAGGSTLLAYNLGLLASFALSGWGAYLLAREMGGAPPGALLAGVGFAFSAFRWDHVVHLQTLSTAWLPLALACALRSVGGDRPWATAGLGLFSALQVLSSGYYGLLTAIALGSTLAFEAWRVAPPWRRLLRVSASLALAALVTLPVLAQYRAVQARHAFSRGQNEAIGWSARPASYLEPGSFAGLPHLRWLHQHVGDGEPLFPGALVLGLGLAGLCLAIRDRTAALASLWLVIGFLLSLGPEIRGPGFVLPGPFLLLRLLPGGELLRTPSRLGVLAILGLSVLAALVFSRIVRGRGVLAFALVLFAVAEAFPMGLAASIRAVPAPPPTAAWLASAPRGPVLELPWYGPGDAALYVYWSTLHWQKMLNGFGSFDPPGNFATGLLGNHFPSPYSARVLAGKGVRYVVIHLDRLKPLHRERVLRAVLPTGVRLAADFGTHRVYELEARAGR